MPDKHSRSPQFRSPTRPIALGFLIFGALVMTLSAYGLTRIKAARVELEEAMQVQTRKIQLVQEMRQVVSARLQALSTLFLLEDPFERDTAMQDFLNQANRFITARRELEGLPLNRDERILLEQLRELTMWATAVHEGLVQHMDREQWNEARQHFIEESLPAQRRVIAKYEEILAAFERENLGWMQQLKQRAGDHQAVLITLWLAMIGIGTAVATYATREAHDRHAKMLEEFRYRQALAAEVGKARDQLESTVAARTAELRETVQRLHEAQEVGRIGNWDWDIEKGTLAWSDQIYRLFGLKPQEFEANYEAFLDALHAEDRDKVTSAVRRALQDGLPYDVEHRVVHPDGSVHYMREQGRVTRDTDGRPKRMLGTVQDVTDRVQAARQEKLAASVFHSTSDAVMLTDSRNHIIDINAACEQLSGFTRDELIGHQPNLLASGRHDPRFWQQVWTTLDTQQVWTGEIWNRHKNGEIYPVSATINAIGGDNTNYVAIFRDISAHKAYEAQLWEKAHHDPLTGLPNRSLLEDRVSHAMARTRRNGRCFALVICDLDGFKAVNDTHGHAVGDAILCEAAHRLRYALRASDTAARLGGDEFALLLEDCAASDDVMHIVEKVVRSLHEAYNIGELKINTVSASLGIALFPQDGDGYEQLLAQADQALYRVKQSGKDGYAFFTPPDSEPQP